MRIAEVIGRLTLSRVHPSLRSARFVVAVTMTRSALEDDSSRRGEDVVVFDQMGASPGALIGLSEGREAANPFGKVKTPIDAYCACLIDEISLGR